MAESDYDADAERARVRREIDERFAALPEWEKIVWDVVSTAQSRCRILTRQEGLYHRPVLDSEGRGQWAGQIKIAGTLVDVVPFFFGPDGSYRNPDGTLRNPYLYAQNEIVRIVGRARCEKIPGFPKNIPESS